MEVTISGRHLTIGDALRKQVNDNIQTAQSKYAERPTETHVTFSKDGSGVTCEITMHLSTGITILASSTDKDASQSFNQAEDKMEKQLRRYKRRLKDHH